MLGRRCSYDSFLPPHHGQNGNGFGALSFDPTMANLIARANSQGQADQLASRFPSLSSKGSGDYNGSRDLFVHSGIPFLLDSQGGSSAGSDMPSGGGFGTDSTVGGHADILANASGQRHGLRRAGTDSSCGDRPSRGHSFCRTDSAGSDQPLILLSKTEDSTSFGAGQLEEGGPLSFFSQGPSVLQTSESEASSSSMSTLPRPTFSVVDSCSTTGSMENLMNQTGNSAQVQGPGSRFGERVPQISQSPASSASNNQGSRGDSFFSAPAQRPQINRTDDSQRASVGSVPAEYLGPWQGNTQMQVAPEQYRVVYPHQSQVADGQRKWEAGAGQYQAPAGTPYAGTAYHWSADWFGAEQRQQQHSGTGKGSVSFGQNGSEGASEGVLNKIEDHTRDSGVMSLTTDAHFSAGQSEAVSPASSAPSDKSSVVRRVAAVDELASSALEGGQHGLSPAGSIFSSSTSSLAAPTGNCTATTSTGISAEASCHGSLAAPDEASIVPSRTTGTSTSSETGDSHSEGGEGSEGGDRCITELTKGNRCIRGAPRATVQQLYGQTYDLEALALEIDRTSLDAMDTGEIRRDYYPGVKFPVGDLGRKLLLIAVREKMEAGTCGQLKFLTLTDLFRLAYELGMWSFALKVSMAYKAGGLRIPKGGLGSGARGGSGRDELWCAKENRRRRKGRKGNRSRTKSGNSRVAKAEHDDEVEDEDEEEPVGNIEWPLPGRFQGSSDVVYPAEGKSDVNVGRFASEADSEGEKEWSLEDRAANYPHRMPGGQLERGEPTEAGQLGGQSARAHSEFVAGREPVHFTGFLTEEESHSVAHERQLTGEQVSQQSQTVEGQWDFHSLMNRERGGGASQWPSHVQLRDEEAGVEDTETQSLKHLRTGGRPTRTKRGKKRTRGRAFEGNEDGTMKWDTDGQGSMVVRYDSERSVEGSFNGGSSVSAEGQPSTGIGFIHPESEELEPASMMAGETGARASALKTARLDGGSSRSFGRDGGAASASFHMAPAAQGFQSLQTGGSPDVTLLSPGQVASLSSAADGRELSATVGGLLPPPSDAVDSNCHGSSPLADFGTADLYFYGQLGDGRQRAVASADMDASTLGGERNGDLKAFGPPADGAEYRLDGRHPNDEEGGEQSMRGARAFCRVTDHRDVTLGDWADRNPA
ncbi:hypothetical protein BESB_068530 [Besnoitia besnoiti]|uniref:Uncharacterized protein n=1 Tax=Besnoitia besnoiti TaxID=94643 RepID=A0A2A9MHB5_BESBE|nr:hypothetical protein BESB_068530 [Besnoitia besnoiti]PFH34820.1 hypothetical protein BESB_068530 [Besnoitia besnoiti]